MPLSRPTDDFILQVRDRGGRVVDVSRYSVNSLLSAALLGHAFQVQDDCTVTIMDTTEVPYRRYAIDARGKPVKIPAATFGTH